MKHLLTAGITFNPSARTLDFSGRAQFDVRRLLGVIHVPSGRLIYAPRASGPGFSAIVGAVLTLSVDTHLMGANDALTIFYDHADHAVPYASATAATRISGGAGTLVGFDLFNGASLGRVVSLYDAAATPNANAVPILTLTLGGGVGRGLVLPSGVPFSQGLWAATAARGTSPTPSAGDVTGSIIV